MRHWMNTLVAAVTMMASAVHGQESPTPAISPEVAADLKDLSAADFKTREAAGRRLLDRQQEAVAPLVRLATTGQAEASVRAFDLLRQLYRVGDTDTNEAVEAAFESLTKSENPNVASRAEAAIDAGAPIRHTKAIAAFRKLGGVVHHRKPEAGEAELEMDESLRPIDYAILDKKWTGGDEGLKYLRRIEDFRIQSEIKGSALFVIKGSKVSEGALAQLQAALPALGIQHRGPACFGVTPYSQAGGPMGLQLSIVKPGSAADRAGLRQDDVLLKFADYAVQDFDALVDKISEHQPGDKVPVEYVRNGVPKTVTVELRGWE